MYGDRLGLSRYKLGGLAVPSTARVRTRPNARIPRHSGNVIGWAGRILIIDDARLASRKASALDSLRACESTVVALSGGVDSALLLALALEALGPRNVLAATGQSASLAASELAEARRIALRLGARHEVLATRELDRSEYRANRGDRCFHCRAELFETLRGLADRRGLRQVVYGAIADDLQDHRPGMRAAGRWGVGAPLLDAGLVKNEVRALAATFRLEVADKPANPCLASRIPTGTEVTPSRLERIERAEAALRDLGFHEFRVRDHGDMARIELDAVGLGRTADPAQRASVDAAVRRSGFRFVTIDPAGYRRGSVALPYRTGPIREGGQ